MHILLIVENNGKFAERNLPDVENNIVKKTRGCMGVSSRAGGLYDALDRVLLATPLLALLVLSLLLM